MTTDSKTGPGLRFFNTREVAIHYAEWPAEPGSGSAQYLFIHGITGRHETWYEVADAIRNGSRAVAVDLRGHGRSGHTTGAYRLPDYARDMAELIRGLKLEPAIVVGHSLGAMTALELAETHPELVRALVLEDPPLFAREIMENHAPERHDRFGRNAQLAAGGHSFEELVEKIRTAEPQAKDDAVQSAALSMFVTDADALYHVHDQRIDWSQEVESTMSSVRCPVLLMQGDFELGAWMLTGDGQRAANLLPDCKLEVWDDTGHMLHSDRPERFVQQVNEFVASLAGSGAAARTS